ncbi:3'-5' exoribonuclease [Halobacillus kuroshimensis]|uniref:3'-5' exoribonuclease n=1 Tax=Halobacillus kuroshimensis TaxID=302481 RepID=A0ABS3E0R0_9BACI|nr:exonuclease domain-containing protein [Halobacillus kuroshimensis]MBN8237167.1 3'-5' exoribonuclease [Halobacillus kuroshimensis]
MNPFAQFVKDLSGRLGSGFSSLNQTSASNQAYIRNLEREIKEKNVLDLSLIDLPVVVFDLETTGFHPYQGDRILSIGAVKVRGLQVEEEPFYSLVHSGVSISEEITRLTGITNDMTEAAPSLNEVLNGFYRYIQSDVLVAHHAGHERKFMNHATWTTMKRKFHHRLLDTTFLTRVNRPDQALNSLDECCAAYEVSIDQRHHALSDAKAAAALWIQSVKEARENGYRTLGEVYTKLASLK